MDNLFIFISALIFFTFRISSSFHKSPFSWLWIVDLSKVIIHGIRVWTLTQEIDIDKDEKYYKMLL